LNYKKIYDNLIEKRQNELLDKKDKNNYCEKHHIIPRCMGGSDKKENLVNLLAKEHFIAHLLLTKIYPENRNLNISIIKLKNTLKENNISIRSNKNKIFCSKCNKEIYTNNYSRHLIKCKGDK
jgi:CMP-2-keto-3-deoxyoctulosonic acid synthetase